MSGLRPSTTGCYLNEQNWRPGISEDKLLNTHFAQSRLSRVRRRKDLSRRGRPRRRLDRLFSRQGDAKLKPSDERWTASAASSSARSTISDEDMPDYSVVSYGLEKLEGKERQAVFSRGRPREAASAVRRAEEVVRHVSARFDRASAASR